MIINGLTALCAALCFNQWIAFLTLLTFASAQTSGRSSLYLAIILTYAPMSLSALISHQSKWSISATSRILLLISILLAVAQFAAVKFNNSALLMPILFCASSMMGFGLAYSLGTGATQGFNTHEIKMNQSRIMSGYYLGMLAANVLYGISSSPKNIIVWILGNVILQGIALFITHRRVISLGPLGGLSSSPPGNLSGKCKEQHRQPLFIGSKLDLFFPYLVLNGLRYLAWGFISFLFPVVMFDYQKASTSTYSMINALALVLMWGTSFGLSLTLARHLFRDYRFAAVSMNIANGCAIYLAYTTPSFPLFITCELLASVVSIIAEIKTTSGYLAFVLPEDRAWLTSWTAFLRSSLMATGNIAAFFTIKFSRSLGPLLLASFLILAGILAARVIPKRKLEGYVSPIA